MKIHQITFQPSGKKISVSSGVSVLKIASENGIIIPAICGGEKLCGKCLIKIASNLEPSEIEKKFFSDKDLEDGFRLACKTIVEDDITVWLLNEKEYDSIKILTTGVELPIEIENDLKIEKFDIIPGSLENQFSQTDSIKKVISDNNVGNIDISFPFIKKLPDVLR